MAEADIIYKPVHLFAEQIHWTGFYMISASVMKGLTLLKLIGHDVTWNWLKCSNEMDLLIEINFSKYIYFIVFYLKVSFAQTLWQLSKKSTFMVNRRSIWSWLLLRWTSFSQLFSIYLKTQQLIPRIDIDNLKISHRKVYLIKYYPCLIYFFWLKTEPEKLCFLRKLQ